MVTATARLSWLCLQATEILRRESSASPRTPLPQDDNVVGLLLRELTQAWNSLASGKRRLHLAKARPRSSSILVSSQLRDMASSLTSR